jgi:hypothetical protein
MPCKFCKKLFQRQSELTVHLRTHAKTYDCNLCSENFRLNKLYQIHMHNHREEMKKIECTICGKRYDDDEKFQLHSKAHEGKINKLFCFARNVLLPYHFLKTTNFTFQTATAIRAMIVVRTSF